MKSGAMYKAQMDAAHAKAIAQQRAVTPVPAGHANPTMSKSTPVKKTGTFRGKSNKLGHGGRAAQLKAKGVPGGVIGELARKAHAAPGQKNYHGK